MKNTRTPRSTGEVKKDKKSYWLGNHKFWNRFQLKTSHGNYKK